MTNTTTRIKGSLWKRIYYGDTILCSVGLLDDGSLHNPNNYPEPDVREAIHQAEQRLHARRSRAAKQAAATRRNRIEKRVYQVARQIIEKRRFGPRENCVICGKGLADTESINRGIGSDCWQRVLKEITHIQPELCAVAGGHLKGEA